MQFGAGKNEKEEKRRKGSRSGRGNGNGKEREEDGRLSTQLRQQVHQREAQNPQAGWDRGHFSAQGKALLLQSAVIQQLRRK